VKEKKLKGNLRMEVGTNGALDAGIGARRMVCEHIFSHKLF